MTKRLLLPMLGALLLPTLALAQPDPPSPAPVPRLALTVSTAAPPHLGAPLDQFVALELMREVLANGQTSTPLQILAPAIVNPPAPPAGRIDPAQLLSEEQSLTVTSQAQDGQLQLTVTLALLPSPLTDGQRVELHFAPVLPFTGEVVLPVRWQGRLLEQITLDSAPHAADVDDPTLSVPALSLQP